MALLKAYQYLFYKLYRFYESSTYSKWWSDWKAIATILVLELYALKALVVLWQYYTQRPVETTDAILETYEIVILAISMILNYYLFDYQDKWKVIVERFDKLPKNKNKIGGYIVLVFVVFIMILYWYFALNVMGKLNYL